MTHSYIDYRLGEDLDIPFNEDLEQFETVEDERGAIQGVAINTFGKTTDAIGGSLTPTKVETLRGRIRDRLAEHEFIEGTPVVSVTAVSDSSIDMKVVIDFDEEYHFSLP